MSGNRDSGGRKPRDSNPWVWVLLLVFAVAMIMGPGPGLYLINPDPGDPDALRVVLGMPIVYVWAVGWFFVQLTVVLIAYFKLWSRDEGSP